MEFSKSGAPCSRSEDVAAHIAGALPEPEARVLEMHAADCSACRELLSALVRLAEPADTAPEATGSIDTMPVAGAAPERAPSLAGSAIGRYELLEQLGVGGMGVVHAAYDPQLKRRVALKILRDDLLAADVRSAMHVRLLREARAMAQLAHPNVVAVYEVDRHDERVFIAMELVEGETLDAWLAARPRSWREVVSVFVAAGQGLAAAHAAGLVHRDFKPANVLIGRDGRSRVTDFGLAHAAVVEPPELGEPSAELAADRDRACGTATPTGTLVGTPSYMAPEQFRGEPADARSDQFSFCVALYRALYDAHPFPGATMRAVAASVAAGRVSLPRAGTRVPRRLHRLVTRGLSVAPPDRYPAMPALLRELENLSRPLFGRRSWIAAGVAVAALAGAGIISHAATRERAVEPCGGAQSKLADLWDASTRAQMRSAFSATGVSYAAGVWSHVEPILDAYATAWTTMYRDACEATRVRAEQSEVLMDKRMACLDVRRRELDQLARLLRRPDAGVVERAVQASGGLSSIADCGDLAALTRTIKPPPDAGTAARVRAARQVLADARVLNELGKYDDGIALVEPLATDPATRDYLPLRSEVSYWTARLAASNNSLERARTQLNEAIWAAEASGYDELVVRALTYAAKVLTRLDRFKEAQELNRRAEAALVRFPAPAVDRIEFRHEVCGLLITSAQYQQALAPCQEAADLARRELGPTHPMLAQAINGLAVVASQRGEAETALGYDREVLAIREHNHGPDHPLVAHTMSNVCGDLHRLGRIDEALGVCRRALAIFERVHGPDSLASTKTLGHIANALSNQGKYAEASEVYRHAIALVDKLLGPQHSEAATLHNNFAGVLASQKDYAGAAEHFQRAATILEATVGANSADYALALLNICSVDVERKRPREALIGCERGLPALERELGRDHPLVAEVLVASVAPAYAANGRPREAMAALDRGIAGWPTQSPAREASIADNELSVARALWDNAPHDRARARAVATRARKRLRDAGTGNAAKRAEVDAWLASHR